MPGLIPLPSSIYAGQRKSGLARRARVAGLCRGIARRIRRCQLDVKEAVLHCKPALLPVEVEQSQAHTVKHARSQRDERSAVSHNTSVVELCRGWKQRLEPDAVKTSSVCTSLQEQVYKGHGNHGLISSFMISYRYRICHKWQGSTGLMISTQRHLIRKA